MDHSRNTLSASYKLRHDKIKYGKAPRTLKITGNERNTDTPVKRKIESEKWHKKKVFCSSIIFILLFFLNNYAYCQNRQISADSLSSLIEKRGKEAFLLRGLNYYVDYEEVYQNKELSQKLLKFLDRDLYHKEQIEEIKESVNKNYTDDYIKNSVKNQLGEWVLDSLIDNGLFQAYKQKLISGVIAENIKFIKEQPKPYPSWEILQFHSFLGLPEAHNLIKSWWIEEDKLTTHKSHCFIPLLQMRDPEAIELSNKQIEEAIKTNGESGLLTLYNRFFGYEFNNSYRYESILKLLEIDRNFNGLSTNEVGRPFNCQLLASMIMEMRSNDYHPMELRPRTTGNYQSCDEILDDKETLSAYIRRLHEFYTKKEQYKKPGLQIKDNGVKGNMKPAIQYAAIHGNKLLISVSLSSKALAIERTLPSVGIQKYDLYTETLPVVTDLNVSDHSPDYNFPIHWRYKHPYFYRIDPSDGNNRYPPKFTFLKVEPETMDSLALVNSRIRRRDSIFLAYPSEKERWDFYVNQANKERKDIRTLELFPQNLLMRYIDFYYDELKERLFHTGTDHELNLNDRISYDFLLNDKSVEFFLRDEWHFSHWIIDYTKEHVGEWKLLKAYTKDSVYGFEKHLYESQVYPDRRHLLPKSNNFEFNSISDPLFYEGQFKCIKQHGRVFIINLEHGGIYSLSTGKIEKIAQIELNRHYLNTGSSIFIEDMDRDKLIFLNPVKKLTSTSQYPDVEFLISKMDIEKKFKKHIEIAIIKN